MEHKLYCEFIPEEFLSNKEIAKQYFRQFGRVRRLIFRPKSQSCIVEYISEGGLQDALHNAGEYKGHEFEVKQHFFKGNTAKSVAKKKMSKDLSSIGMLLEKNKTSKKDPHTNWVNDPEIQAELDAMGGIQFYRDTKYDLHSEGVKDDSARKLQAKSIEKVPKLKRSWKNESPKSPKKKKMPRQPATIPEP